MDMAERFRELHQTGCFVLPNPWDVGSAKILQGLGFKALATTSSGHAATFGRTDQQVTLDELLRHAEDIVAAVDIPLNLDSERCFGATAAEVEANVARMGDTGAAGCSIEDYNPQTGGIDPVEAAVERVAAAAAGAVGSGMVLTGRCENHLYGVHDLDNTIGRLIAYRDAGAEVLYAPGLHEPEVIRRVVAEVDRPINILANQRTPAVAELADLGVRRISTGSGLARAALGALITASAELREHGTSMFLADAVTFGDLTNYMGEA